MPHPAPRLEDAILTRRELLGRSGMGMGALALAGPAGGQRPARRGGAGRRRRLSTPLARSLRSIPSCPRLAPQPRGPSGSCTCS